LRDKSVLVTGGAGFIGSHLVERLLGGGYRVRVLDNLSTGKLSNIESFLSSDRLVFLHRDIRDQSSLEQAVVDVDSVVHLAAQTSVPYSMKNPEVNDAINVEASRNLLRLCSERGVRKFVFASSCAVYGNPVCQPIDETHPANPISPYGQSKLEIEKESLRMSQQGQLQCAVLRFFNVYGPRQGLSEYSGVITKFLDRISQRQPLVVYGDGLQTRDFVFVKDVVRAIELALKTEKASGQVFNIGTGIATSIETLARKILKLTGCNLEICNYEARSEEIRHSKADITKANVELGFYPAFTLGSGLASLLALSHLGCSEF
jgi:UDP-glucose 4-epimerase